jgi:hypothetical protein
MRMHGYCVVQLRGNTSILPLFDVIVRSGPFAGTDCAVVQIVPQRSIVTFPIMP